MKAHLKKIDEVAHGHLLYLLNRMPSGDDRAKQLEKELKEYLSRYHAQLAEIAETMRCYFETVEDIKRALPDGQELKLVKRRPRVWAGPLFLGLKKHEALRGPI